MKLGEAEHLHEGDVLVCYMADCTYFGTFMSIDGNDQVKVTDVRNENGVPIFMKKMFYIPRTNIADARQVSLYKEMIHPHIDKGNGTEIGGDHYQGFGIQPITYIEKNHMSFDDGNVVKYISRYMYKNGAEDVQKAIDYCTRILADKYHIKANVTYESI